ncbi:hypothetical protein ABZP36_002814 [Zizania latifolia]
MEMEAVPVLAVVDARFCAGDTAALEVAKTLSLSGNDFAITDVATGAVVLWVDGVLFSLCRWCLLVDADCRPVLTMQESEQLRCSSSVNPRPADLGRRVSRQRPRASTPPPKPPPGQRGVRSSLYAAAPHRRGRLQVAALQVGFCASVYTRLPSTPGSADKTVKFWDLETFELIGSTGPEISRMEISSDSEPFVPKSGRRLESSAESRKESSDSASGTSLKISSWMEMGPDSVPIPSKASRRVESATDSNKESADVVPVVVPRTNSRIDMASDSRREISAGRMSPFRVQSRYAEQRKLANAKVDTDKVDAGSKNSETDDFTCHIYLPQRNSFVQTVISEETREEVKPGMVDRLGFPSSAQPNTHCSENYVSRMRKPKGNCYMEVSRAERKQSSC